MDFHHFFSPKKLKTFVSNFNTNVELVRFSGSLYLDMGNLTQSGKIIENIWAKAFKDLLPRPFLPQKILVLGFGGGSVAKLISKKWPNAKITGIEIDPVVVKIARQHFHINEIPNLKLINQDAYDFVSSLPTTKSYSLIIVDCYLGDRFPQKLESLKFLKKLTQISDHVLINRLFWDNHKPITLAFCDKLKKHFPVHTTRTASNFLIHLQQN